MQVLNTGHTYRGETMWKVKREPVTCGIGSFLQLLHYTSVDVFVVYLYSTDIDM
jgi:hypothetical protein